LKKTLLDKKPFDRTVLNLLAFFRRTCLLKDKPRRESTWKISKKIPKRMLVVDDEKSMRDLLTEYLNEYGYEVTCAVNGQDALQIHPFGHSDDLEACESEYDGALHP